MQCPVVVVVEWWLSGVVYHSPNGIYEGQLASIGNRYRHNAAVEMHTLPLYMSPNCWN